VYGAESACERGREGFCGRGINRSSKKGCTRPESIEYRSGEQGGGIRDMDGMGNGGETVVIREKVEQQQKVGDSGGTSDKRDTLPVAQKSKTAVNILSEGQRESDSKAIV